jgi:Zn-dependent alcohol dehydrogenase
MAAAVAGTIGAMGKITGVHRDGGAGYSFECASDTAPMRHALECTQKGWGKSFSTNRQQASKARVRRLMPHRQLAPVRA